ncbi:MAG: hypothetical protein DHS20C21_03100 [Gemmatimonadota bacterium]|nr:MAG: hypothetical protein DHS20C21_03100 [Gemmatimonadota bacterium]
MNEPVSGECPTCGVDHGVGETEAVANAMTVLSEAQDEIARLKAENERLRTESAYRRDRIAKLKDSNNELARKLRECAKGIQF